MAAISDKALKKNNTPYKYNDGSELEEELNYYNTFYRKYDAQIGRFTGVDIQSESSAGMSVYNYAANNPIYFNDPNGDRYTDVNGTTWHSADPFTGLNWDAESYWGVFSSGGGGAGGGSTNNAGQSTAINGGYQFSGDRAIAAFKALLNAVNHPNADGMWKFSVGENKNGDVGYWQHYNLEGAAAANGQMKEVVSGWRFVDAIINNKNPGADKAAIAWADKWKPIADRDYAEYSGIIYWYQNKKGDVLYGATNGVRYDDKIYRKNHSPGPRHKLQNAIPTGAHHFAHIHIHVEATNGNQNFSRGDEEMFVHPINSGLLNYYLVTPADAIRFRNVDTWDGFEYWVR